MAIIDQLLEVLRSSTLGEEEILAFTAGLEHLNEQEQELFYITIRDNADLVYPLYIQFKAKLHAMSDSPESLVEAVEKELALLDAALLK